MLYYVVRGTSDKYSIGSYMNEQTAKQYNQSAKIYEDLIMSEELGFPIEGLVVRGYSRASVGYFAKSAVKESSDMLNTYARTESGDWMLVGSVDSFSFSKINTRYKEVILLESTAPLIESPRSLVKNLGGKIVPTDFSVDLPGGLTIKRTSSGIYEI